MRVSPHLGKRGVEMPAMKQDQHRDIIGIRVAALGWREALDSLTRQLDEGGPQRIFNFLNANNANLAMRDAGYRQGLSRCEVLPDGVGVEIASRTLHGISFPAPGKARRCGKELQDHDALARVLPGIRRFL